MLDAVLRKDLVELIGSNFNSDQINKLGQYVLSHFDVHELCAMDRHITVPALDAGRVLVEQSEEKKKVSELLEVLIETDGEKLEGRKVTLRGLEEFLSNMTRSGLVYDFDKRKVRKASKNADLAPNWGSLRDGREYPVTIASIDIVGNSELVRKNGMKLMEKAYYRFWTFLQQRLSTFDGRTWSWAGDGGILAFALKGNEVRATQWALEVQATIPIFNASPENPIPQDISARIGLDCGKVKFRQETGRIVSDTINYAAHLEKSGTAPGQVSISEAVYKELPERLSALFKANGVFEERQSYTSIYPAAENVAQQEGEPTEKEVS